MMIPSVVGLGLLARVNEHIIAITFVGIGSINRCSLTLPKRVKAHGLTV